MPKWKKYMLKRKKYMLNWKKYMLKWKSIHYLHELSNFQDKPSSHDDKRAHQENTMYINTPEQPWSSERGTSSSNLAEELLNLLQKMNEFSLNIIHKNYVMCASE
jgi:hypothetical protein